MIQRYRLLTAFFVAVVLLGSSLLYIYQTQDRVLFLATTTSVENSGLLDILIPEFEKINEITIKITARGSGAATDLVKRGEVDAVIIHAPNLEQDLISNGYGINRTVLWFNYFVMIGPTSDPANISNAFDLVDVMNKLRDAGEQGETSFYSRGDGSGTHIKELELWNNANLSVPTEKNEWYFETGSGMASTIRVVEEKQGYTLSDMGTFLQLSSNLDLSSDILFQSGELLYNPYSYIIGNPAKFPNLNTPDATTFLQFLQSEPTMTLVESYKVGNTTLFTPVP